MRILIAYFSQTGNTAQVARAIKEAISAQGHDVDLEEVGAVAADELNAYDLLFMGSACHDTDLARPAKQLLATRPCSRSRSS